MTNETHAFAEMAALITRYTPTEDLFDTAIPDLSILRRSRPSEPFFCAQWPTFALAVQGAKTITLGAEIYHYGVGDFMVVSMDLPVIGQIVEASSERPLLSLGMTIRPERIGQVMERIEPHHLHADAQGLRGVGVNRVSMPLMEQEILYRLLTGPYGPRLIQNLTMDSPANRVGRAVNWLRRNYARPLRMEELAAHAGMSISSLHHHFRNVTAMTPMQYQKQLRLNEAHRLMLVEKLDVGSAGFTVGYATRSQFGLEYARHFGTSPSRDIAKLRSQRSAALI